MCMLVNTVLHVAVLMLLTSTPQGLFEIHNSFPFMEVFLTDSYFRKKTG